MSQFQKGYVVTGADGQKHVFDTQSEAKDFLRNPLVLNALKKLSKDADTATWLLNQKDNILESVEAGKVRRVSKAERKELEKALENTKSGFLFDNMQAVLDSFKWPAVSRPKDQTDEQRKEAQHGEAINALNSITGDDEEMSNWIITNIEALKMAYETGKEAREVSPKAKEAIKAWHSMTAEQKQAHIAEKAKRVAEEKAAKDKAAK